MTSNSRHSAVSLAKRPGNVTLAKRIGSVTLAKRASNVTLAKTPHFSPVSSNAPWDQPQAVHTQSTAFGAPSPSDPYGDTQRSQRRRALPWVLAAAAAVVIIAAGVIVVIARSGSASSSARAASTDPVKTQPVHGSAALAPPIVPPTSDQPNSVAPTPTRTPIASAPSDVPSLPHPNTVVPVGATAPGAPSNPAVVSWSDSTTTPSNPTELVEWSPPGANGRGLSAIKGVVRFMLDINAQNFAAAWSNSTERLSAARPTAGFEGGWRTSRFYQAAFGQPRALSPTLIAVPVRFISRQDPAAQGNPDGVTDCSFWPQYVYLASFVDGRWLPDVAGRQVSRSVVAPMKRSGDDGRAYLNPVAQRSSC